MWAYSQRSADFLKKELTDMGNMDKYLCVCGWVYDPKVGDP